MIRLVIKIKTHKYIGFIKCIKIRNDFHVINTNSYHAWGFESFSYFLFIVVRQINVPDFSRVFGELILNYYIRFYERAAIKSQNKNLSVLILCWILIRVVTGHRVQSRESPAFKWRRIVTKSILQSGTTNGERASENSASSRCIAWCKVDAVILPSAAYITQKKRILYWERTPHDVTGSVARIEFIGYDYLVLVSNDVINCVTTNESKSFLFFSTSRSKLLNFVLGRGDRFSETWLRWFSILRWRKYYSDISSVRIA